MLHHILAWALGAIGLGGIAAAIVFIPGASAIALKAFGAIVEAVSRYPWQVGLAVALIVAGWQHHSATSWKRHAELEAAAHRTTKHNFDLAMAEWKRQAAQVKAAREKAEKDAKEVQDHAQATYAKILADNRGLRDYIASRRLRAGQAAMPLDPAGSDQAPGVPDDTAAGPLVATRESDLVICDELYAYAFGAYGLGLDLRNKALALPAPDFGKTAPAQ